MDDYQLPEADEGSSYEGPDNSDPEFTSEQGADDQSIDFRRCPLCGEPLEIASDERLYGSNALSISTNADGQLIGADWTTTEVDFNTSTTTCYRCLACQMALPERYREVVEQALNSYRHEDE